MYAAEISVCSGKSSHGWAASQVTGPDALSVAFVAMVNGPPVYVSEVLVSEIVPLFGVVATLTRAISAPIKQRENATKIRGLKEPPSDD